MSQRGTRVWQGAAGSAGTWLGPPTLVGLAPLWVLASGTQKMKENLAAACRGSPVLPGGARCRGELHWGQVAARAIPTRYQEKLVTALEILNPTLGWSSPELPHLSQPALSVSWTSHPRGLVSPRSAAGAAAARALLPGLCQGCQINPPLELCMSVSCRVPAAAPAAQGQSQVKPGSRERPSPAGGWCCLPQDCFQLHRCTTCSW